MLFSTLRYFVRPGLAAGAAALMLSLVLPADATSQDTRRVILTDLPMAEQVQIASLAEANVEEADRLLNQAQTAKNAEKHHKAAELFERSAQLRMPGDERGIEGFEAAGAAYLRADKPKRASRTWEEAGNRALILGDVYVASQNFMRAAMAAHETDNRIRVSDMAWKAYHLTESPQLTKAQRTTLRQHIGLSSVNVEEAQAEWNTVYPHWRFVSLHPMDFVNTAELKRLRTVEARYRTLRDSLAGNTASRASRSERATMTEMIHFAHDRSDLSNEARAILRDKIPVFRAHPSMSITVTGFASQPGGKAYNSALGLRRAEAARDYLVSQGIEKSRIQIATGGDDELVVQGSGEVANAANRRGEFRILMAEIATAQD